MKPRKVGQDIVIRKKTSAPSGAVSESRISQPRKRVVLKPNTPISQPQMSRKNFSDDEMFSRVFSPQHGQVPPARGGVLWIFVGVATVALVTTIISLFTRSTVTVTLQEQTYAVNTTFPLYAEPAEGQIGFKTATIVDRQSVTVPTKNQRSNGVPATGKVRLFSTNTKSTVLPAGTKLVSTAEKTFTTKSAVTIPAGTTKKPGSAEVVIVASAPGESFNIGLDDLRLPSFPKITAKTVTEITGGSLGGQFVLSEAELTAAKASLQGLMDSSNPGAFLANQIPKNFMLPASLVKISEPEYVTESTDAGVRVTAERSIVGYMIDTESFKRYLVQQIAPDPERGFMQVSDMKNIVLSLPLAISTPEQTGTQASLQVTGSFTARAQFDEVEVRTKIAKEKKTDATRFLKGTPGVIDAEIHVFPPWIRRVPNKVSAINFSINYQSPKTGQNP